MEGNTPPVAFKVIFLGCQGVGKTSIINYKISQGFTVSNPPTCGCGYYSFTYEEDCISALICVWDTAGQEQYAPLIPLYIRETIVAVIVASVVDNSSIEKIDYWISFLKENGELPRIVVALNKLDLVNTEDSAIINLKNALEEKYKDVVLVSAKNGEGVNKLFKKVASMCISLDFPAIPITNEEIAIERKEEKGCC